ncbi:flagellar hook-length control protein FliK [Falsirhodobacter sp. 20TX0035]|uniref:flagellar hook-length control protein FliK n=1 Tax=Falsirhodobacter sp. 20TX0035 TaxID=3022019 RepID=UPI00232F8017|nr:flagellar hook-length control protein FliK [Falsirhodobacter sp. 20TX0035]MDB6452498.1 flagellar hook-length control protein FliK [Falsirhodobacter sp. 20TX0035]
MAVRKVLHSSPLPTEAEPSEVPAANPAGAAPASAELPLDVPQVPADPPAAPAPPPTTDPLRTGQDAAAPEPARKQAEAVVHAHADALSRDTGADDQGRVHVTLHRDGDDWRVVVSSDNPATLDLMRRHADQLQQDLAQQGFGGAQLDFSDWAEPPAPEPPPETEGSTFAPRAEVAHYTHSPLLPSSGLDLRL